jgi:4-amino-4-deoxy-L-arabinose transferase-like glycosyltransferase
MTASFYLFFDFYQKRNSISLALMYIALGFAILTKGPVALGLTGLIGVLFLIMKKDFTWSTIKTFQLGWGIFILLIILLPWFIEVGLATEWQWQKNFLLEHNLNRLTQEMEGHGGFIGLTILYVFMALLPFSIFLIQAYRLIWKKRKENDLLLFSIVVSLVIVLFFTISATKLPNYPMPAYPFIAIIIGHYLSSTENKKINYPLFAYLAFSFFLPAALYFIVKSFSELSFLESLTSISLIIPIGAIVSVVLWLKSKNLNKILISLAIPWIIVSLLVFLKVFPYVSRQDPVQHALPIMTEERPIAYYRRCNSAFPWYIKRPIQKLTTLKDLTQYIESTPKFYLISAAEYDNELSGLPLKKIFQKQDLFESPITVVYEPQP